MVNCNVRARDVVMGRGCARIYVRMVQEVEGSNPAMGQRREKRSAEMGQGRKVEALVGMGKEYMACCYTMQCMWS